MSESSAPFKTIIPFVNKDAWNNLPPSFQQLLIDNMQAMAVGDYSMRFYGDMEALQKFKDYGNEVLSVPAEVDEAFFKAANEFYDEKAAEDPFFAEVLESQRAFQASYNQIKSLNTSKYVK